MSADTAEPAPSERRSAPQSVLLLGVTIGLLLAAGLCLVIARQRLRGGWLAGDEPGELVWRTSAVVAVAAVIVVAYLGPGRLYRRSSDRWSRFLAATSAVPAAVALGGLITLYRGTSAEVFSAVAYLQRESGGPIVTAAAREAWWLACLAVAATAVMAAVGYLPANWLSDPAARWPASRIATTVVASAVASILVVPVVLAESPTPGPPSGPTPDQASTVERVEPAPIPSTVVGQVAYRVDGIPYDARVAAAGPGFVAVFDGEDAGPARLVGYDGATGRQRWSYQPAAPTISTWTASGTGPESVVVFATPDAVLGIDATTGQRLWERHLDIEGVHEPTLQASSSVVAVTEVASTTAGPARSTGWTALAIRTGEQLWAEEATDACGGRWELGEVAVLAPACHPEQPDVAAKLLDPGTGRQRGEVKMSTLGIDAVALRRDFGDVEVKEVDGSTAILEIRRVRPTRTESDVAIDLRTGRLLAAAPEDHNGYLLDSRSMAMFGKGRSGTGWPGSILELSSRAIVPTGLYTRGTGGWFVHPQLISVGTGWVTSLSTAAEADKKPGEQSMSPLRALDSTGALRTLPPVCAPDLAPALATLAPGALLVRCGDQVVGLR